MVLDCGSGAVNLGSQLMKRGVRRLNLFFTHFHIDHTIGFPFFGPIFLPICSLRIFVPVQGDEPPESRLQNFLNGEFHPLHVQDVPARTTFVPIGTGDRFSCGPYQVQAVELEHPGGACGYRIEQGDRTVCYFTDTSPLQRDLETGVVAGGAPTPREQRLIDAMQDADVLIFDTMFSFEEYMERQHWGHSFPEYAYRLARKARVQELYLFHHLPGRTDAELDTLEEKWSETRDPVVRVAREGMTVDLEG